MKTRQQMTIDVCAAALALLALAGTVAAASTPSAPPQSRVAYVRTLPD